MRREEKKSQKEKKREKGRRGHPCPTSMPLSPRVPFFILGYWVQSSGFRVLV